VLSIPGSFLHRIEEIERWETAVTAWMLCITNDIGYRQVTCGSKGSFSYPLIAEWRETAI